MKPQAIVTLDEKDKYYLADVTEYNNVRYFIANKLDEQEELTEESCIFEEIKDGNDFYLDKVTDPEIGKYLATVFVANVLEEIDEM